MPNLILNPESEIVIFFGPRGKGKSSLMAHFVDNYLDVQGESRLSLSRNIVSEENKQRKTPLTLPTLPPVYAKTKYKLNWHGAPFEPMPITGKEIGISNDKEKYKALFPAPLIAIDEAHKEFCSGDNLPNGQFEFLMECRHYRVIMLLAAPRAVQINKNIRTSGSRFIEPREVVNYFDDFKRLYKTVWYCREFNESGAIEEYISSNGQSDGFIETIHTHNGNVREIYDGYAFRRDFFPKDGKDFET